VFENRWIDTTAFAITIWTTNQGKDSNR